MFKKIPAPLKNFYILTAFFFLLWMIALDSNNLFTRYELGAKLNSLENERAYYEEKIKEVEKDHNQLFGDRESLEKFAREKYFMKKETEDIFIIEEKD